MFDKIAAFGTSAAVIGLIFVALYFIHQRLLALYADKPALQYRRQLIMLVVSVVALVLAIVMIPIGSEIRGQLLSLLGILLSATIALSSTTIVGNAMAGLMLKSLQNVRPGDFVYVGEHSGRVSEMDLLHVEVQTEDRNLTTLPNLYFVTNPVTVLRDTGTILSVEVSLGYDVPRSLVEELLIEAAEQTGLESPFVQIMNLGDFSVTYRVAGVAKDLSKLIATRRKLRAKTLDVLHAGGVEIVSPNFMTTRSIDPERRVVPPLAERGSDEELGSSPDDVVFDKARKAESLENLRDSRSILADELAKLEASSKESTDENVKAAADNDIAALSGKIERLDKLIAAREAKIQEDK